MINDYNAIFNDKYIIIIINIMQCVQWYYYNDILMTIIIINTIQYSVILLYQY